MRVFGLELRAAEGYITSKLGSDLDDSLHRGKSVPETIDTVN